MLGSRRVPTSVTAAANSETVLRRSTFHTQANAPPKVGPNDPCSCSSGKKFKKCCGKN